MNISSQTMPLLLHFLLLLSLVCPLYSLETIRNNQTFLQEEEFHKLKKIIETRLQQINKPAVKTIHSPDGDIIDCVESHKQPAFDHPLLKGQKPLDPPERSRGHAQSVNLSDIFQLWTLSGESCPKGTIPIRRTTEEDMFRAISINTFGRKLKSIYDGHEHAIELVLGDGYNGAQASLNVWTPQVESRRDFSLAQIWIASQGRDKNTIEAGWQVYPRHYGDNRPRFFIYWTADGYKRTGCYNLVCAGFVQTNTKITIGAAISPTSTYKGGQYDITLTIWKDQVNGNWWLEYGSGNIVGYWPSALFTHLKNSAYEVQFGGEIYSSKTGSHTSTQMGSGHFAEEGFGKAAYFRNMLVMNSNNIWIQLPDPEIYEEKSNCYNIEKRFNDKWGDYFYYGGPGRNENCP